jgi:hypothetical protein
VGTVGDYMIIGREAGEEIRAAAGEKFFAELMAYVQNVQVLFLFRVGAVYTYKYYVYTYVHTCVCYVGVRARVASVRLRVGALYLTFISLFLSYFSSSPVFSVLSATPVSLPPSLSLSLHTHTLLSLSLALSRSLLLSLALSLSATPVPLPPSLSLSLSRARSLSLARSLSGRQHEAHQGRQGGISMRRRICSPYSNTTFHPIDNGSPLKAAMVA